MCLRQHGNFGFDTAHSAQIAAINTWLTIQNGITYGTGFQLSKLLDDFAFLWRTFFTGNQRLYYSSLQFADARITLLLISNAISGGQVCTYLSFHCLVQSGVCCSWLPIPLSSAHFSGETLNRTDCRLHFHMAKQNSAKHLIFA